MVHKKVGDAVEAGDLLATFYGRDEKKVAGAVKEAEKAFKISSQPVEAPELIKEILGL